VLQSTTLITVARSGALFGSSGAPECSQLLTNDAWYAIMLMVITMTAGTGVIMWMGEWSPSAASATACRCLSSRPSPRPSRPPSGAIAQQRGIDVLLIVLASDFSSWRRCVREQSSDASRAIRQTHGRAPYLRREQHLHPDQGQHGRVSSRSSSLVAAVPARTGRTVQPAGRRTGTAPWVVWVTNNLTQGGSPLYMLVYFLLIIGFTYFYVAITFNPEEVADNMKKYGGFIPASVPGGRPPNTWITCSLG
jgi:preprotein translocase subunit SecY